MEIRFLKLHSAKPAEMLDFYQGTLQLPCLASGPEYCLFQAGSTLLMFEAAEDPETRPFYHFAFDIPRGQLPSASAWISSRVELLESKGETEIHFPDWNATGIYFHDPSGNIVELIARHNLPNDAAGDFTPEQILRISEIGWPVTHVLSPGHDFQLPAWRDYGKFQALGSETGLILLVESGRPWLPTNRPCEAHPVSLVLSDAQGVRRYVR